MNDAEGVPQPSKRVAKYLGEMTRLLQFMDSIPPSDWPTLSTKLADVLKCVERNNEAAAEVVPDPTLLCRVMWKCFDPKGVMGVHRRALDVLQRLCQCMGAFPLMQQAPLLLVGVLNLLPHSSMQLKCELLHFVKLNMLLALPPEVVAVELPGIVAGVLGGLEESETSEVYRLSLQMMDSIYAIVNRADLLPSETSTVSAWAAGKPPCVDEDVSGVHHEDSGLPIGNDEGRNDVFVYRALWFTLKNSPSLRGAVLLYLKLRLGGSSTDLDNYNHQIENNDNNNTKNYTEDAVTDSNVLEGELTTVTDVSRARVPLSSFVGGNPRIAHSAIFATLQERSERRQRLMLDVLISAFPLSDQSVFAFEEQSLLVAAAVQLLGLPDVTTSIRRRIAEWLTGPTPEGAVRYTCEVSSLRVAQAFHGVVRWWESRFVVAAALKETRERRGENNPVEGAHYQALFASACKYFTSSVATASTEKRIDSTNADVLPIVWLRALLNLFQFVIQLDEVNHDHDVGVSYYEEPHNTLEDRRSTEVGSLFMEHVAPQVLPYVCDLLVSMELRRRDNPSQSGAIDSTLNAFFLVVPWDFFTNYQRGIILMLERRVSRLQGDAASEGGQVGAVVDSARVGDFNDARDIETVLKVQEPDIDVRRLFDLEVWFQQLNGMTEVLEAHLEGLADRNAEKAAVFHRGVFAMCHSLCGLVRRGVCNAALKHGATYVAPVTVEEKSRHTTLQRVVDGCLDAFNISFFRIFSTLQEREELKETCGAAWNYEVAFLAPIVESAVIVTQLVVSGLVSWSKALTRMNDTVFSLLSHLHQLGTGSALPGKRLNLRTELLQEWVESIATMASSACPVVVQDALQLYVDLLGSSVLPPALYDAMTAQKLAARLVPCCWHLLGTCSTEMQPRMADLLVHLHGIPEGHTVLDTITTEDTTENCERLVLLFRLLIESGAPQDLFLPGLFMMLRTLHHKDASRQRLAQSMVRQLLPHFHRVLNPLFAQLLQQPIDSIVTDTSAVTRSGMLLSSRRGSQDGQSCEVGHVDLMEFLLLVKCLLSIPSFVRQLLEQLHQMPPPPCGAAALSSILPSLPESVSGATGDTDVSLQSAFAALGCVLLAIARRGLTPLEGTDPFDGKLCVEACETLNLLLEGSLRLPNPPETIIHTWRYTSVHAIDLLRDAVERQVLPVVQILLLRHIVDAVRFLDSLNLELREQHAALISASASSGNSSCGSNNTNDSRINAMRCCSATLKSEQFQETVVAGVELAAAAARMSDWATHDLLSVWCDTLLELLPFFHEERDSASTLLLKVLIGVVETLLQQNGPLTECATSRVIEKCIGAVYGVLEFHLVTLKSLRPGGADAKKNIGNWFSTHVPIFGSGSSSAAQKAAESGAACTEAVRLSLGSIVSTVCRVHCRAQKERLPPSPPPPPPPPPQHQSFGGRGRRGGEGRSRHLEANVVTTSRMEAAIYSVLRLYAQELGANFFRVFIDVWAAAYAQPLTELVVQSWCAPAAQTDACLFDEASERGDRLFEAFMSSGSGGPSHPGVTLSNREAVVLLLSTGTATSALSLIRIAEELLMQHRSSASASTSSRHSSRAEMSFDAAVFYFVHVFLRTCPVPPGDVPQILNALLDLVATHLSCGTPSTLSLPFILQVLSGALPLNALASSSSPNGREGGAAVEWGKDKRYSLAICKTLEWYSSTVSHTSTELDVLLFLLRVVSSTLPALACSTLSDQDRIASAALCFYRRSLLPTIQFGIESPMEADVHARTPLVKAALFATQTMVNLSDIVSRRLRQEFLDILFTCDFFRFPQSVLHEWSLVFERLSQDRTFHADAVQFFTPSSSPTSRIVALVHSAEEEERQRVRHLKRLVFYTTSVSPSLLMTDREFCLLLRGRIADTFRSFFPTASGSGAGRRPPSYLPVRHALVLFRVLLTKLDPALLHHFWPLVLPEVARVLTATPWKGVNDGEELLALRIDCLKLLDFALVIMPEAFSPFRWVFFDDMDACTTPTACTENTFTPIVRRFGPAALPLHDVCASATSALVTDWTGYQRPLLRLPTLSYCSLRRFHTCAKTLSLFSQTIGAVAGGGGQDQHESVVHLRLLDGWDEAYVRSILEADLSCVLEKLTLSSSPL